MRTVDTGFDFAEIRKALDSEDWEKDPEDRDYQVRRVWLGTITGITPSGKFYVPFACSNVADDCPVCDGRGMIKPRTGRRIRARAMARQSAFARRTLARGGNGRGRCSSKFSRSA